MSYIRGLDDSPIYSEMVHWLRKHLADHIFLDDEIPYYPNRYSEFDHKTQIDAYFRDCRKHLIEVLKLEKGAEK